MSVMIVQDPKELWVHIEITPECGPVKYEYDPEMGLVVDRFMRVPMRYPLPYGYAPKTLCGDGDALDVLVIVPFSVVPMSWIKVRPVAVMVMEDEKGMDEKILAVPANDISTLYSGIQDIGDVDQHTIDAVNYFFERYKDLDANKWARIHHWGNVQEASEVIAASMVQYASSLIQ